MRCYTRHLRFGEQKQTKGDAQAYPITHSGFTGHEEVEPFNLIHMGGRLYDPVLGRFLSADPTVQSPSNPQDLNRYSYCVNNPLRFTDPSGFGIFDWVSDVINAICDVISDVVNAICDVVSSICNSKFLGTLIELAVAAIGTFCGLEPLSMAYLMAGTSAAVTAASGGNFADVLFAAGLAFISVKAWGQVGDLTDGVNGAGGWKAGGWTGNFAGNAESCALHGVVGGTLNAVEGGSFKDGFLSAAVGDACSGMVNAVEKDAQTQTAIMERSAAAGVIGGTAAVISGGNFIDGAKTAAFAQMFNDEAHKTMMEAIQQKMQQVRQWCAAHQTGLMVAANIVGLVAAPFTAGLSEEAVLEVDGAMAVEEASSAMEGLNLQKSLASTEQIEEIGETIAGGDSGIEFRDASRIAEEFGGSAMDWVKQTSTQFTARDGTSFQTHWVENITNGQRVEFKTKF